MGALLNQQCRVWDDGAQPCKPLSDGTKGAFRALGRYRQRKGRLTTCQQPRYYVGPERCPELLGIKGAQAAVCVRGEISGLNPEGAFDTAWLESERG